MRNHRKVYQNFVFNIEDIEDIWKREYAFYLALVAFFPTGNLFHPD